MGVNAKATDNTVVIYITKHVCGCSGLFTRKNISDVENSKALGNLNARKPGKS